MKEFVKMVLAVICGLFLMTIIGFFLMIGFFGSLAAASGSKPVLPREGVLDLNLNKVVITEQGGSSMSFDPTSLILGGGSPGTPVGIWEAVQAINKAAEDKGVKYIYLRADQSSTSTALLEELRKALENFRKSGKAVIAFTEAPTVGSYYLYSVADKVYMSNVAGSTPMMTGIGTQMFFLKDLLDKVGVNVQLIRHGKYKSAGEMYIKNAPSPENMEQNQEMVNSMWNTISTSIASGRDFTPERLSEMIDNLELNFPEDVLRCGLADELFSREELQQKLADLATVENYKDIKMIPFADYVSAKVLPNLKAKKKIAVIYAEGNIVEGSASSNIAGDRFASIISDIRKDNDVKAVVFRVSSPGGSVTASDKIKKEIDLLRAEKPVIASYGDYAASGGYWVSNSCDKIFSDETTLTGSIGVFSMIPDLSNVLHYVAHVNAVTVGSSPHADMYSAFRPLSAQETDYMQASIEKIYETFVNTVAEGRDLRPTYVDSLAQGRVWTGADGLKIGLVDEIGTLEDAINYAATAAGDADLTAWNIVAYPKPKTEMESLMEMFGMGSEEASIFTKKNPVTESLEGTPFESLSKAFKDWDFASSEKFYARMPYEIIVK
ncbi:MAG: signal peptide peptidase SppA [Bacteroidales bacterium]|nr:signal peptide peptidase SppA [Bacteroidales bacterium]